MHSKHTHHYLSPSWPHHHQNPQPPRATASDRPASNFHRVIPNLMFQGGNFTVSNSTSIESVYGSSFANENFIKKHFDLGILSMANADPGTSGSQFFICFAKMEWLDEKHVVFGQIMEGMNVVKEIEKMRSSSSRTSKPMERSTPLDVADRSLCGGSNLPLSPLNSPATCQAEPRSSRQLLHLRQNQWRSHREKPSPDQPHSPPASLSYLARLRDRNPFLVHVPPSNSPSPATPSRRGFPPIRHLRRSHSQ